MNARKALQQLLKLSKENRDNHAENLLTNPAIDISQVRYSQGYINALDWVEQTLAASMKEKEDTDDEL